MEKKKFGSFIKESRLKKRLTQQELADLLFIDVTAVSKWERGVSYPDITLISAICKNLDVSEKELIESSTDEEYRKIKKDAKNYNRINNGIFYGFSSCYAIAILVCFIVNLSVNHTLSWFFIVLASCLVGFTFVPSCVRFFTKHRLIIFISTTFVSLFLLYLTCSIYTKNYWFILATLGTALGYFAFFAPFMFFKTKLGLSEQKFNKIKNWFMVFYSLGLLLLTLILLISVNSYRPFNLKVGILITLYSYTILLACALISLLKTNVFTKLGSCFLCFIPYLYGLTAVLSSLLDGNDIATYYDVNFKDWSNHINGNVSCIIVLSIIVVAILFFTLGFIKSKKIKNNRKN